MQIEYTKEIKFLLNFSNPSLSINKKYSLKNTNNLNWEYILAQGDYHQISPYIYVNFKKINITLAKKIEEEFKLRYVNAFLNFIRLNQEFKNIVSIFNKENIEFVPLKGFALINILYKNPLVRTIKDIDILTKPNYLSKVETIIKKRNYKIILDDFSKEYYKKHHCEYTYRKNDIILDVHWALSFNRPYEIKIPDLWKRTKSCKIDGINLTILSIENNLIALALHQRRFDKPLYLKSLIDIHLLIEKFKNNIDWNYMKRIAIKNKLKSLFYLIFFIIEELFNTPIPKQVLNKFYPGFIKNKLIHRIIRKYLFYSKNYNYNFRKSFYFKLNFIWYDTLWDTLSYILWLPQEKFAAYYKLYPYSYKTTGLYKIRFLYTPLITIYKLLKKYFSKPVD